MDFLYKIFGQLLYYIYDFTGNYGVAIIVFTILMKLLLLPLNIKQTKSMKDMQRLNPELQKLSKKYKNNKEKLNEETLKLYKVYKVNPAAGCLPLLVQFPILIGLFNALKNPELYVFINGTQETIIHPFLWSANLGIQDVGFWIPDLGSPDPYFILPILAALFTFATQKLMTAASASNPDDPNAKTQKIMLYIMPIMIGYISINFPAGVALYWVVQNVFTFVQQFVMLRMPVEEISPEEAERRVKEEEKEKRKELAAKRAANNPYDQKKKKEAREDKGPLTKPVTNKKVSNKSAKPRNKPISEIPKRDPDD